jgi:hypothetical protein
MTRTRPLALSLAAAIAATGLATAGPAAAKGGDKTPAPAPPAQVYVDPCADYWDTPAWADGSLPVVNPGLGGCVIVRHYPSGINRLDRVILLSGWSYTLKYNGEGTTSRVLVEMKSTSGGKSSVSVENGRTVIK